MNRDRTTTAAAYSHGQEQRIDIKLPPCSQAAAAAGRTRSAANHLEVEYRDVADPRNAESYPTDRTMPYGASTGAYGMERPVTRGHGQSAPRTSRSTVKKVKDVVENARVATLETVDRVRGTILPPKKRPDTSVLHGTYGGTTYGTAIYHDQTHVTPEVRAAVGGSAGMHVDPCSSGPSGRYGPDQYMRASNAAAPGGRTGALHGIGQAGKDLVRCTKELFHPHGQNGGPHAAYYTAPDPVVHQRPAYNATGAAQAADFTHYTTTSTATSHVGGATAAGPMSSMAATPPFAATSAPTPEPGTTRMLE